MLRHEKNEIFEKIKNAGAHIHQKFGVQDLLPYKHVSVDMSTMNYQLEVIREHLSDSENKCWFLIALEELYESATAKTKSEMQYELLQTMAVLVQWYYNLDEIK